MAGLAMIAVGAALMIVGVITLIGWIGGRSGRFGPDVCDRQGSTKVDRQFLHLYFVALVLAPLLGGAILIAFGLRRLT